jgi:twitching motility protein PilJ
MAELTRAKVGRVNPTVVVLSVLVLIATALVLASFLHNERWARFNEHFLLITVDEQALVPRIASAAKGAARGDEELFGRLHKSAAEFEQGLKKLEEGDPQIGLPASPAEVSEKLRAVDNAWSAMRKIVDRLLTAKKDITRVRDLIETTAARLPELIDATEEIAGRMVETDASPAAVFLAAQQVALLERMENALGNLLRGGAPTVLAIDTITSAVKVFAQNLEDLLEEDPGQDLEPSDGPKIRAGLEKVELLYKPVRAGADELIGVMPQVTPALNDVERAVSVGARLGDALNELVQAYSQTPGRMRLGPFTVGIPTIMLFGGVAALFLILLGIQMIIDARHREAASQHVSEANQQSILRLLDEMGDLADGDLTVEATVTEDITGAIADSINYAVEALRSLVTTINNTSEKVTNSAQQTRKITQELAEASELQTRQISSTTQAINTLTGAIDEVANNATESAEVASRSVEVASRGAQTVRDTIAGMDSIREQIQETSKRIKRLGESSQEIGEIVELIDDIADQTNILALNAAMQAAQAGEAGRGFAVVADEVQGLAERSRNATKQIEALVRTIQADTNEAVSSMEASTTGVVEGATLAENAGDALREIENVSNYIADMTRRIADSAQRQSQEASKINATVSAIQEITKRNAEGSRGTALAVETLAELALEQQKSVAGFRLP